MAPPKQSFWKKLWRKLPEKEPDMGDVETIILICLFAIRFLIYEPVRLLLFVLTAGRTVVERWSYQAASPLQQATRRVAAREAGKWFFPINTVLFIGVVLWLVAARIAWLLCH